MSVIATRRTPNITNAKPDKTSEAQRFRRAFLVSSGRPFAAFEFLSTIAPRRTKRYVHFANYRWNRKYEALFRGQSFRQIHRIVKWRGAGGHAVFLQQKGHNIDGIFGRHRVRCHHRHLCVYARPQSRDLFAPICLPEWLAYKRGPHTAFERSTMTAGTSFLVSLGTRRGLLGGIPSVALRCLSAHAKGAHQHHNSKQPWGKGLHNQAQRQLRTRKKDRPYNR